MPELAGAVVELLAGDDLDARVGVTLELITVDDDGWPRVALLSVGEVLAVDRSTVRLALWPRSQTTANLERTGQAIVAFVHGGAAHRLGLRARRAGEIPGPPPRAAFEARVETARRDEVPYARLLGGITFELEDGADVVARWRATIAQLRERAEVSRPAPDVAG